MMNLIGKIAQELSLREHQVENTVKLLFEDECTIPFVCRYRKELTGSLDETALRAIRDRHQYLTELETTKERYLKVVEQLCNDKPELKAQWPMLKAKFENCQTKNELEDLYLPFKPKRRTRAMIAKEKGLEPLLEEILKNARSLTTLEELAKGYITINKSDIAPALRVKTIEEALAGAADIYAERMADDADLRSLVREISNRTGKLVSKKIELTDADQPEPQSDKRSPGAKSGKGGKSNQAKYENYYDYQESITTAASHRIMAVRRGEAEKVLRLSIEVDTAQILGDLKSKILGPIPFADVVKSWVEGVVDDAYKRLIAPSIETELRLQLKNKAEEDAIVVFSENLQNLLLLPPIPGKTVMGVDPGIRTGSKIAIVDDTGKLLAHTTIYPDLQKLEGAKTSAAKDEIRGLIKKFSVQYIAIGNGTASKEISRIVTSVLKESEDYKFIKKLVVNEAGASVYSTDEVAIEEFPDLDATIRSAVSIARRLQDPLAELVKIDPRSIGVGQYQHDVNPTKLDKSLGDVVESCVNRVGVNVNTASHRLLAHVSGIGKGLAKNIVKDRETNGKFFSRGDLLRVSGFGPKAFQQAAGFMRIPESENPLDNSAVHPEAYTVVEDMAKSLSKDIRELVGNRGLVSSLALEKFVTETVGMPTLQDITSELIKPGRDPREEGSRLIYSDDVSEIEDLKVGMKLPGTVTNVTNFGAFVDIGVHQDGLVHISELSDQFVQDPSKVVAVGQVVEVRVIEVDANRRRISLSMKSSEPQAQQRKGASVPPQGNLSQNSQRGPLKPRQSDHRPQHSKKGGQKAEPAQSYTLADLMAKFNKNR